MTDESNVDLPPAPTTEAAPANQPLHLVPTSVVPAGEQEVAAMDDTNYELWTDNGDGNTRMITLGDIIKTTGIFTNSGLFISILEANIYQPNITPKNHALGS